MSRSKTRLHPFYVAPRTRAALARIVERALGSGWTLDDVMRRDERTLSLCVRRGEGALCLAWIEHGGASVDALARGERYAAWFERLDSTALQPLAIRACRALASVKTPHLVASTSISPHDAVLELHLEPDELQRWLEALVPEHAPLLDRFRVRAVRAAPNEALHVELVAGECVLLVWITMPREDALYTSEQLSLGYVRTDAPLGDAEAARVVFELGMRIEAVEPAIAIRPSRGHTIRVRPALRALESFQVSISGACGQRCAFCCLTAEQRRAPPEPDPDPFLSGIREAARRGARVLRINGIEPLRAPYVVELIEEAQRAGITRIELKSSCRPLADRALAERIASALRVSHRIDVPLYGSSAALHDRIVGSRGAFDEVMQAIANLRASLRPEGELRIETVLVPENVDDLPSLAALARDQLGSTLGVSLPHPTGSEAPTVYPQVALTLDRVLGAVFPPGIALPLELAWGHVPLCAELAHERRTGARSLTMARFDRRAPALSGARYAVDAIDFASAAGNQVAMSQTTPCPHADRCYAAPACPACVYTLYADARGLSELAPIARSDLAEHEPALLEAIDALHRERASSIPA